jgi:membrane protein YdbS with pleckstrin-like domain
VAYPRRLLNDHETVVVDLHPHWWCLAAPTTVLLASMAFAVTTLVYTDAQTWPRTAAGYACLGLIAAAACWLVARSLRWVTTNFAITTQRVINRSGVLSKHGIEIPLDRVNTVMSSQGPLERLVGAGDLVIESGGEFGVQRFEDVRNPDRVKQMLHGLVHDRRHLSDTGGGGRVNIAEQLEKFEGMLERGTLTRDEFDAQKQRLLDSL